LFAADSSANESHPTGEGGPDMITRRFGPITADTITINAAPATVWKVYTDSGHSLDQLTAAQLELLDARTPSGDGSPGKSVHRVIDGERRR
jgi:hypothetical protein